ncbi:2-octaprenyl-6-methoxyphenyl hydroxylase [Bartonella vinsonii subsp. berkhoffii str. Tweed]|uniref:2-octaprenyl-6-methoxyphenyl hydroxylase n=1 Tax=Bartonella vinsonii subsp. berkhoffii str. Tweed TaxID=1094502 RepID=N6VIH7_BARVB|nr:ubiquinone biosynthesis hydroxylase [Bartonella vinsonii]AGF76473.1 2-octaprenyl-6-methoxyphenyl hydroxylase [Bartonella vinsonii subsp. berkhoffii str. Winnie]ENN93021.1 2-octaprenyl-6-methoxyphenyl hydroxylase [Bartonella vinsonii subsp. berkhoffii str. Tweed]
MYPHPNKNVKPHKKTRSNTSIRQCDLLIAGGAAVGLALAIALKQAAPNLNINIVDAAPQEEPPTSHIRTIALSAASIRMLKQLRCWEYINPFAQPIHSMIITDTCANDPVKPTLLTFEGDITPNEPFAAMVEHRELIKALKKRVKDLEITFIANMHVVDFHQEDQHTTVTLSNEEIWQTKLLIAANGAHSKLREKAGLKNFSHSYKQTAIICTINHEKPHHGQAIQHFLPAGPFALLPLKGNRSAIVWNEHHKTAQYYFKADTVIFETELEKRIGHRLGKLSWNGERQIFPLSLSLTRQCIQPRFALVGDAAHTIHPIAGQGLNLGLRDSAALAEVVIETARLGLDIGSLIALERYQSWRRFEIVRMALSNDWLNRLFSNDNLPLRMLRDAGLGIINQAPKIKKYFIQEASGLTPNAPRLLHGLPL